MHPGKSERLAAPTLARRRLGLSLRGVLLLFMKIRSSASETRTKLLTDFRSRDGTKVWGGPAPRLARPRQEKSGFAHKKQERRLVRVQTPMARAPKSLRHQNLWSAEDDAAALALDLASSDRALHLPGCPLTL